MSESVAVVIPVYNGARYLAEAIESVLAQTRPPERFVVIDDGSKDDSLAVARQFPQVEVVAQANSGVCRTRNSGAQMTGTDWIAFLDQDDVYKPKKLQAQLDAFAANPDADVCFVGYQWLNQVELTDEFTLGRFFVPPPAEQVASSLYGRLRVPPGSFMVRSSKFWEVGGFEPTSTPCEDWDLLLRLAQAL